MLAPKPKHKQEPKEAGGISGWVECFSICVESRKGPS